MYHTIALALVTMAVAAACSGTSPGSPEGVDWTMRSMAGDRGLVDALAGAAPTLRLDGERASGTAGCNRYAASYTLAGSSLSFGPIAATKMFCADDGVMEQEDRYLSLLDTVDGWSIDEGQLILEAGGTPVLVFAEEG